MDQPRPTATMTNADERPKSFVRERGDLFGRTLRTVVILVAACVLFVGALSVAAVAITSKAVGSSPTAVEVDTATPVAKKPRSI
ncbi:MAG TPA: hypothetical protein VM580_11975 [Labilithrix sp.]|jgi:hypothetical protein|nr:hypothetical protein [Labilithrix sp.]